MGQAKTNKSEFKRMILLYVKLSCKGLNRESEKGRWGDRERE